MIQQFGWKPENFFTDAKVVALCHAIEKGNLGEIDRLVADGADVNAKGKGNMTPLLWAYPDNRLDVFTKILEYGADPNVQFTSDFGTRGDVAEGSSVLEMSAMTWFPGYFKAVMKHGGDPNLISKATWGNTPLISVIEGYSPNKIESLRLLIDAGADINAMGRDGQITPLMKAVSWCGQYDLAICLLEAGADWEIMHATNYETVVNSLLFEEKSRIQSCSPTQKGDYDTLVKLLKQRGADFEEARRDEEWLESMKKKYPDPFMLQEKIMELRKERLDRQMGKKQEVQK